MVYFKNLNIPSLIFILKLRMKFKLILYKNVNIFPNLLTVYVPLFIYIL